MSQYCTYDDLVVLVDAVNLAAMSNDYDGNLPVNMTVINNICAQASNKVDALISSIYTPFSGYIPSKVKEASIIFSLEILYARRLTPDEKNPFKEQSRTWLDLLTKINAGELDLDAQTKRVVKPVIFSATISRLNSNIY